MGRMHAKNGKGARQKWEGCTPKMGRVHTKNGKGARYKGGRARQKEGRGTLKSLGGRAISTSPWGGCFSSVHHGC